MKHLRLMPLLALGLFSGGCVEVQDKKKSDADPAPLSLQVQHLESLRLSEPRYVWNGELLTHSDFEKQKNQNSKISDSEMVLEELHFLPGGAIYTMGNNVRFHIGRLTSDQGLIATFPAGQKAPPGRSGRKGGHVLLSLKEARGLLTIEMRGEAGGDGEPGPSPDETLRGEKGAQGSPGWCRFNSYREPGVGGTGGEGLRGFPGKAGGDGGDSGTLELVIEEGDLFTPLIQKVPGTGGQGGPGGDGGPGGFGGDPGVFHQISPCPVKLQKGADGKKGPSGYRGPDGKNGQEQVVCTTKKKAMACY